MKLILSITAATMLAGALFVQPAQAACWATPYGWQCSHPHYYWHHHRYWHHW